MVKALLVDPEKGTNFSCCEPVCSFGHPGTTVRPGPARTTDVPVVAAPSDPGHC